MFPMILVFLLTVFTLNANMCILTLPSSVVQDWKDTQSLEAIVATDYQSKAAAINAGYEPIGYYINNSNPTTKRSMELLQDQRYAFVMAPKSKTMQSHGKTTQINYPVSAIERMHAINLPSNGRFSRIAPQAVTRVQHIRMPYRAAA